MARICWWSVETVARLLPAREAEAVFGDLTESGVSGGRALLDILGLVARRQAAMWMEWRPWIILTALIFPFGILLSLYSRMIADGSAITIWLYANNWDWAFPGNTAFRHDFPRYVAGVLGSYLALACYSWMGGFVIGALSRGLTAIHGVLFCLALFLGFPGVSLLLHRARDFDPNAAVFAVPFYRVLLPPLVLIVLAMLPSLGGMREGLRLPLFGAFTRRILWSAMIAAAAAIVLQSLSVFRFLSPSLRLPVWNSWPIHVAEVVIYWPVMYWIISKTHQQEKSA